MKHLLPLLLLALTIPADAVESPMRAIALRPDDVTTIMAWRGSVAGALKKDTIVSGFATPQEAVTWTVIAPREDDYALGLIFSGREGGRIEVRCGESFVTAPSMPRTWPERPFFWRQELPGTLHLKAGENRIALRLLEPTDSKSASAAKNPRQKNRAGTQLTDEFSLWSIELGSPAARTAQAARARNIRGDASWMIAGKYGLFVHWSPLGYALEGDQPRAEWHAKAVDRFDVKVFADAVQRTGAAWIIFTMTHGKFYWPGPSAAIDRVLPGRTTKRDLIGEIIGELDRRGIRTLFYLHNCAGENGDPAWAKAVGALDPDTTRFGDNVESILRESSLRYGTKLHGYGYIDDGFSLNYQFDPPWERWARAIKAGNPAAVVGISSSRGPIPSPFSELSVTDGGTSLAPPNLSLIGPGQQLGPVTPAWWCTMDTWIVHGPLNGKIGTGPRHPAAAYVKFFQEMAAAKIPVTINLAITADVTAQHPIFNPECQAVMDKVRVEIRRK